MLRDISFVNFMKLENITSFSSSSSVTSSVTSSGKSCVVPSFVFIKDIDNDGIEEFIIFGEHGELTLFKVLSSLSFHYFFSNSFLTFSLSSYFLFLE